MSKIAKLCRCLSWIAISHSTTVLVFFYWLSCNFSQMLCCLSYLNILSKITLLIYQSSFFAVLISLTVGLFKKFSWWSFSDVKQFFSPSACILLKALLLRNTYYTGTLIFFLMLFLPFLYAVVIESFSVLSSYSSLVKR